MSVHSDRTERLLGDFVNRLEFAPEPTVSALEFSDASTSSRLTRRFMGKLNKAGLVAIHRIPLYDMPPVADAPLFSWRSGESLMAFNKHRLEYVTKKRFSGAAKQTVVYCATKRASAIYGGRRPPINRLQANHNAHMATVLAHVLIHKPEIATGFVAEHALRWHRNSKRPDAVVYGDDFQAIEVHESGGTGYPATRIEAHFNWVRKWAETQDLHYFFW